VKINGLPLINPLEQVTWTIHSQFTIHNYIKNIKLIMFELWGFLITPWHISLGRFILALLIFIFAILFRSLFANVILKLLKAFVGKKYVFDDEMLADVSTPLKFVVIVFGFYLATLVVPLPADIEETLTPFIRSLIMFALFWALYYLVESVGIVIDKITLASKTSYGLKSLTDGAELTYGIKSLLVKGSKILIVVIGLMVILNEWGINIVALLAGLGIASAAVALTAKETLSNIFSSLAIILNNTFKPGDWIMTPDVEGIVEEIGSRETKIRTFSKAIVTIPNAKLTHSVVTNFSRMTNRRIKMRIGLEYRTRREQVTRIIQRFHNYLQNHPSIEIDSSKAVMLVHLAEFNDSSIDILLYYFTKTTHWQEWMRIREENMLEFMKIVEEEGAAFAFPSQQIYLEKCCDS